MSLAIISACVDGIVVASDGAMTGGRPDGTYRRIREDAPKFFPLRDDIVFVVAGLVGFTSRAVVEMRAFVGRHPYPRTLFYDTATFLAAHVGDWYATDEAAVRAARPDLLDAGWTAAVALVGRDGRHGRLRLLTWQLPRGLTEWDAGGNGLVWLGCHDGIPEVKEQVLASAAAGMPAAASEHALRGAIREAAALDERVGSRVYSYRIPRNGEPRGRLPDETEHPAAEYRSLAPSDWVTSPVPDADPAALGGLLASQIACQNLAAIAADFGDIHAGLIHNAAGTAGILVDGYSLPGGWTRYLRLDGTGTMLKHDRLELNYDGTARYVPSVQYSTASEVGTTGSGVTLMSTTLPTLADGNVAEFWAFGRTTGTTTNRYFQVFVGAGKIAECRFLAAENGGVCAIHGYCVRVGSVTKYTWTGQTTSASGWNAVGNAWSTALDLSGAALAIAGTCDSPSDEIFATAFTVVVMRT